MIRKDKYLLPALIALCGMWAACTQQRQPCLTPKIASLIIESMHKTSDTATVFYDTLLPAAEFWPVTTGMQEIFISNGQAALFTISLSPGQDSCRWLFRADTVANSARAILFDTLTFHYKRNLQFLSNACGYTYFYTLDTVVTSHINIDSVHITNYTVNNNVNTKHLQIYIHPDFL